MVGVGVGVCMGSIAGVEMGRVAGVFKRENRFI
jgi:hypothetical protein